MRRKTLQNQYGINIPASIEKNSRLQLSENHTKPFESHAIFTSCLNPGFRSLNPAESRILDSEFKILDLNPESGTQIKNLRYGPDFEKIALRGARKSMQNHCKSLLLPCVFHEFRCKFRANLKKSLPILCDSLEKSSDFHGKTYADSIQTRC